MPLTPNKVTTKINMFGLTPPFIFEVTTLQTITQMLLQHGAKAIPGIDGVGQFAMMVPEELLECSLIQDNILKVENYPKKGDVYPELTKNDYTSRFSDEENAEYIKTWNERNAGKQVPLVKPLPNEVGSLFNFRVFQDSKRTPIKFGAIDDRRFITTFFIFNRDLSEDK